MSLKEPLILRLTIGESDSGTGGPRGKISTSDGYIGIKATDSLGHILTSVSFSIAGSSYNNSVTGYSASATGSSTTLNTDVAFTCSSTKGSADVVASLTNAKNETITSNTFKVYCVGGAYTYSAALDKSSYAPGDLATLTITAKDSAGNPCSDSSQVGTTANPIGLAGSNMTAVTAPTNVDYFYEGVKKYQFIVGSTGGSYQMAVSLPALTGNAAAVAVPYKITSSSVSNEEVLAAIVKLIASINKQIAALQKALTKKK